MNDEESTRLIQNVANGFRLQPRAPILGTPADENLEDQKRDILLEDGVPLEAWVIPRNGSDKLIIVNHPRYFNRYGFPFTYRTLEINVRSWR